MKEFMIGFIATFGILAATDAIITEQRKKKEEKKNAHVSFNRAYFGGC